ncbi:MAG: HD domain-containing protein, partial [Candidatus Latescibacterota bacterium]
MTALIPPLLRNKMARWAFLTAAVCVLTLLGALVLYYPQFFGIADRVSIGLPGDESILLLTAISMCMAFLLSIGLARRSVTTLRKLQAATEPIQSMDLDFQIDTNINDFDEFGDSLCRMAARLRSEFDTLRNVELINTKILSTLDKHAATATLLARYQRVLPADSLAVCLCETSPRRCLKIYAQGHELLVCDPVEKRALNPEEIDALRQSPSGVVLHEGSDLPYYLKPMCEYEAQKYMVFPVFVGNELAALFAFGFKKGSAIYGRFVPRARQVADEFGMALANIGLIDELDTLNWGTMTALARAVDAKSPWTAGHSERVTALALDIGRLFNLGDKALESLQRGALLHDLGKVGIPVRILDKPDKLTVEERKTMEKHVEVGEHILDPIPSYRDLLPMVRHHHESFDGTGYPDGLAGENIDFRARIVAVA